MRARSEIQQILERSLGGGVQADGILLDIGVSSMQVWALRNTLCFG